MRAPLVHVPALALFAGLVAGQSQTAKTVDIYLIDVEGGNAQLYRLPSGEAVLIASGNGGAAPAPGAPPNPAGGKGGSPPPKPPPLTRPPPSAPPRPAPRPRRPPPHRA